MIFYKKLDKNGYERVCKNYMTIEQLKQAHQDRRVVVNAGKAKDLPKITHVKIGDVYKTVEELKW